jgi:hypothetical protein
MSLSIQFDEIFSLKTEVQKILQHNHIQKQSILLSKRWVSLSTIEGEAYDFLKGMEVAFNKVFTECYSKVIHN